MRDNTALMIKATFLSLERQTIIVITMSCPCTHGQGLAAYNEFNTLFLSRLRLSTSYYHTLLNIWWR